MKQVKTRAVDDFGESGGILLSTFEGHQQQALGSHSCWEASGIRQVKPTLNGLWVVRVKGRATSEVFSFENTHN